MSPEVPLALVPATACEVIASPPSLMSVQLAPRLPSARLKSSEPAPAQAFCGITSSGIRRKQQINKDSKEADLKLCAKALVIFILPTGGHSYEVLLRTVPDLRQHVSTTEMAMPEPGRRRHGSRPLTACPPAYLAPVQ